MHRICAVLVLVVATLLAACGEQDVESLMSSEESQFAETYLDKLRARDFHYIRQYADAQILADATDANLVQVAAFYPDGEPISVKMIGFNLRTVNADWWGSYTFEYEFPAGWVVASVTMQRLAGAAATVIGFDVYRTPASQRELNAFTLSGKTLLHYAVLALAVAVPAFMLITLVFCIRTPMARRKWLWIIFILVGVSSLSLNWTTGEYVFQILHVNLLGVGVHAASAHAPWILTLSIPLGAIIFWIRRRELMSGSKSGTPTMPPSDPAPS